MFRPANQRSVVLSPGDRHNRKCDERVHVKTAGTSLFADQFIEDLVEEGLIA